MIPSDFVLLFYAMIWRPPSLHRKDMIAPLPSRLLTSEYGACLLNAATVTSSSYERRYQLRPRGIVNRYCERHSLPERLDFALTSDVHLSSVQLRLHVGCQCAIVHHPRYLCTFEKMLKLGSHVLFVHSFIFWTSLVLSFLLKQR
jgi:hypothetical protein